MLYEILILINILAVATYYLLFAFNKKWVKAPPGPKGLPLIGNLHQMDKFQHVSFGKWAKEFGPIYKLELANTKMVVVSDHKMIKEMFSQSIFSGRMDLSLFDFGLDGQVHGLINTEGPHWEELRHFTLRQLRDFGFGKKSMEESIMMEVNELIESLKSVKGMPITNVKDRFFLAVVNALWFIVTGIRHNQSDPELIELINKANVVFGEMLESGGVLLFAPWLAKWFPTLSGYEKIKNMIKEFAVTFETPINDHVKTYSPEFQRDFMDVFIKEIYKTTDPKSAFHGNLGMMNLLATMGDLYFAGSDTTSTTLSWMMMYLSKHPEIQKKFYKEIESITGNTRSCSVADRPDMPYTEALIAETLRFSSIAPSGVQHKVLSDTEFKGYFFPKDTVITPNIHHIHFDPEIWGDPQNFRPERHLSPDGKVFKKHEALLPFVIGRRQCLGETMARDNIFLFSTNIVQQFSIEFDKNGPDHGYESVVSFLLTPKPFNLIMRERLG